MAIALCGLLAADSAFASQNTSDIQRFRDAFAARDKELLATLTPGGFRDFDMETMISVDDFLTKLEGCNVKSSNRHAIFLDCAEKREGRPQGKCLSGDINIVYLSGDGYPAAAAIAKARRNTPECTLMPPPPPPLPGGSN